jgi:cell division protein FtsQ
MPTKVINKPKTIARKSGVRTSNSKRPVVSRAQNNPSALQQFLRRNVQWLFLGAGALVIGFLLFVGYQKVIASSIFEVKRIDIAGGNRTDNKKVEETARMFSARTGVWNTDLTAVQKGIEQIPWVKTATVSRVLPDGLRIRLMEREPKAIVRLDSGAKVWVDDDARVLGEVNSNENTLFVMTGWNEARDSEATKKNQERLRLYLQLSDEFRKAEIAARITAIDLSVLQDVEILVDQNGTIIPVRLGNRDFAERLKLALALLEPLESNGTLETVEKVTVYDRAPVVGYKTAHMQNNAKVNQKKATKIFH